MKNKYTVNKENQKKVGHYLFQVEETEQWKAEGFDSMDHFIRFNADAFASKKGLPGDSVYADMVKAFESHKEMKQLEESVEKTIEFEKKLSEFSKEALTTLIASWFIGNDQKVILKLLNGIEGCLIIEEHKNKAGAKVTTQQQPASNLMS